MDLPGPRSTELRKRAVEAVPEAVSVTMPIVAARGQGARLWDVDGNEFIDFAGGLGCLNAGHTPQAVVEAVKAQAELGLHFCFSVTMYESYIELAQRIADLFPGPGPNKTLLVNSGAEAVENAVKVARYHTGRQAVIAFDTAFHGRTLLAMTLTSKVRPYKLGFGPTAPDVYRAPFAYCYRCPVNLTYPSCELACLAPVRTMLKSQVDPTAVAAVLFEPVQGEGGFVDAPPGWIAGLRAICDEHGILLVDDEVQSGVCRTGPLWAIEADGVAPDLMTFGKSIAGGLPLAGVSGRADVFDSVHVGGLGGTFGGNPVSCAAGLAILDEVTAPGFRDRATAAGNRLRERAASLAERYVQVGDVRGRGPMVGLELVRDRTTKEPADTETKQVLAAAHRRGLVLLSAGLYSNVVRILVPLIASDAELDAGCDILDAAFAEVFK